MCIFYLLHELTGFNSDIPDGKRNSRIFILGIILYCLVYILIINLWDKNCVGKNMCDAIFWAGLILFLSDVFIMGYIYRSYYGRSIVEEINSDQDEWLWDDQTHKFYQVSKIKIYKDELEKKDKRSSSVKNTTHMEVLVNSPEKNTINISDNVINKTNAEHDNKLNVGGTIVRENNKLNDNNNKNNKNEQSLRSSKSSKHSKHSKHSKISESPRQKI